MPKIKIKTLPVITATPQEIVSGPVTANVLFQGGKNPHLEVLGKNLPIDNEYMSELQSFKLDSSTLVGVIFKIPVEILKKNLILGQPFYRLGKDNETSLSFFAFPATGSWISWEYPGSNYCSYLFVTSEGAEIIHGDIEKEIPIIPVGKNNSTELGQQARLIVDLHKNNTAGIICEAEDGRMTAHVGLVELRDIDKSLIQANRPLKATYSEEYQDLWSIKTADTVVLLGQSSRKYATTMNYGLFGSTNPLKEPEQFFKGN